MYFSLCSEGENLSQVHQPHTSITPICVSQMVWHFTFHGIRYFNAYVGDNLSQVYLLHTSLSITWGDTIYFSTAYPAGLPHAWKTFKILEKNCFIFKALKVLEFGQNWIKSLKSPWICYCPTFASPLASLIEEKIQMTII